MSLEVAGSSPVIYPILFQKLKVRYPSAKQFPKTSSNLNYKYLLKYYWVVVSILKIPQFCIAANWSVEPLNLLKFLNLKPHLNLLRTSTGAAPEQTKLFVELQVPASPTKLLLKHGGKNKYFFSQKLVNVPFLRKTFTIFIKLNFFLSTSRLKFYSSPKQLYFNTVSGPIGVNLLRGVFRFWHTFYIFLTNLLYFNLSLLYFTNNFFKKEALALNWNYFTRFQLTWKYTHRFFYFLDNKISHHSNYIFLSLRKLNFNIAFVSDVQYHRNTLYYLSKVGFYILGLVPGTNKYYFLNFIIPLASNNFISQFFFLRTLLQVKLLINQYQYKHLKSAWHIQIR